MNNLEDQNTYSSKFSQILEEMDIFQSNEDNEKEEENQDQGQDNPSDVDQNGSVGFADVLSLLGDWGCGTCPDSDVDNSGSVDFSDLLAVIANWGDC